jgi:hypothetical protein
MIEALINFVIATGACHFFDQYALKSRHYDETAPKQQVLSGLNLFFSLYWIGSIVFVISEVVKALL